MWTGILRVRRAPDVTHGSLHLLREFAYLVCSLFSQASRPMFSRHRARRPTWNNPPNPSIDLFWDHRTRLLADGDEMDTLNEEQLPCRSKKGSSTRGGLNIYPIDIICFRANCHSIIGLGQEYFSRGEGKVGSEAGWYNRLVRAKKEPSFPKAL